jgi:hypothetical protein
VIAKIRRTEPWLVAVCGSAFSVSAILLYLAVKSWGFGKPRIYPGYSAIPLSGTTDPGIGGDDDVNDDDSEPEPATESLVL